MTDTPKILDVCCGSRMFWFDRENSNTVFMDIRKETHTLCDGRLLTVSPDVIGDFRDIPYPDNSFYLVVFDPPHLKTVGENSWMIKKYGKPGEDWQKDIKQGFDECMRVLKPNGTLIFKWNETQIPASKIIEVLAVKPLIGHISGKASKTHWMTFMKQETV